MTRIGFASFGILPLAVSLLVLSTATARAATDEQRCLSGRAKAKGKYEQCVNKWLAVTYRIGGNPDNLKASKCREKYAKAWTNLQALIGTTCDAPRWVDNGDGTVSDNLTGLIWERKTDDGTVHDWDDLLVQSGVDLDHSDEDGNAYTTFLAGLNAGAGFDGANGWRLPTFAELQTILLPDLFPCATSPCIDAAFGAFTKSFLYASTTTSAVNPVDAWAVNFIDGSAQPNGKSIVTNARAVRGGL